MIEGEVNAIAGEVKHMETEISEVEKKFHLCYRLSSCIWICDFS